MMFEVSVMDTILLLLLNLQTMSDDASQGVVCEDFEEQVINEVPSSEILSKEDVIEEVSLSS